ncbi:Type II secretion system protein E [Lacunisphaera limnophila]|uniref:Type II secretion system protein E n=1 Tax=Lacunisphaera limnophila TaxID=1838286 RepID=A0A1D8AYU3_9BACT|nr:ATPase, T2SS/T4P/T4SS family [Lacunisphaera limnophila]AOS46070.1 Type II secretion system protein E [Lacunisphaera limnophila]
MTTAADPLLQIAHQRGLLRPGDAAPADRTAVARAVAEHFGMAFVEIGDRLIAADVRAALPADFVRAHQVVPCGRARGRLQVAIADPIAADVMDSLEYATGEPVEAVLATAADIRRAIVRSYDGQAPEAPPAAEALRDESATERDAPVIRLVRDLITDAIRRRASDIHLEPLERRFRVRYRIDGVLHEAGPPPKRLQLAIISRLKIMANISIAEKRVPQDGRIQVTVDGRALDLRVSSLPTAHGESIVMRILDAESLKLGMPELGFLPDDQAGFERQIAAPDGIMLVTGPTGSGKTTTLYASLQHLNRADRKIITVEEPVEYQLTGINQVPVNAAIGMTFAAALRAMLRQAPNVVMVGEIRDAETAEIAINASLTGHMVFSTLHTNDAPSAVTRLIDIGAKPFLVAAALRSVMAQRLVRRICPDCRRAYTPAPRELQALGLGPAQVAGADFAHGAGCAACHGTGYRGRMGIFEIFLVHDGIRGMIYDNVTAVRLREQARRDGMRTMREDGIRKVLAGLTTIEEVVAVTVGDTV